MDQLFAQIMQQLQVLLEQAEGKVDGSALPLDGDALPSESLDALHNDLVEFAEHLQGEVSPTDKDRLTELVQQLVEDNVPQEQVRQLTQTALLLQDSQRQELGVDARRDSAGNLLELVQSIRSAPAARVVESKTQAIVSTDSIDELLLQAEKLLNRSATELTAESATAGAALVPKAGIAAESKAEQDASFQLENSTVAATEDSRQLNPTEVRPELLTMPAEPTALSEAVEQQSVATPSISVYASSAASQASATLQAKDGATPQVAPIVRSDSAGENSRTSAANDSQAGSSVRAAAAAESGANTGDSGDSESSPDRRERIREQGLARWVELRDSVLAQGQKLAQNESVFKEMLGSQALSARAEAGSLSQATNPASLMQLQQAYQTTSTGSALAGFGQPFGSQGWTPAASQRISWMAGQNISRAELRLDPPELGSLTIRLTIQGDQTSLSFTSPHAHVREVLEQQLPRLREMLSESGLQLGHADVSDQSSSHSAKDDRQALAGGRRSDDLDADNQQDAAPMGLGRTLALVDYYA